MELRSIIDVKANNIRQIIEAVRFRDSCTKKDIAQETGLSFATVSNLCRALIEGGVLAEESLRDGGMSVGRSPKAIRLRYDKLFGVCIDMHRTDRMTLAITNLRNEIAAKRDFDLQHDDLGAFAAFCHDICRQLCASSGIPEESLLGLCIAVPAIFDHNTGLTVASGIQLIEGKPLKAVMAGEFGLPAFVDNEANLSSASIRQREAGATANLIYLMCSEGLGAGIISDGAQLVGSEGYSSEICHIPIGDPRLTCRLCGNAGCVESDLCVSGFITKRLGYREWDFGRVEGYWNEFLAAVDAGDAAALAVLEENAAILGKLVSILVNLFDPEVIYFGGEVSVLLDRMLPRVRREVDSRLNGRAKNKALLLRDADAHTILKGCAEVIYSRVDFTALANDLKEEAHK